MTIGKAIPAGVLAGLLAVAAPPAAAHSGHTLTWAVSSAALNAYATGTVSLATGAHELSGLTLDHDAGYRFAHASGSEVTPTPLDEEVVGSVTVSGNWTVLLCASTTQSFTLYWETDLTGAPSGAVGRMQMAGTLGFVGDVWILEENDAADDYLLVFEEMLSSLTCTTQPTSASFDFTLQGTTASGGHPVQNPATSGCYGLTAEFGDTAGGAHSASVSRAFGAGSC